MQSLQNLIKSLEAKRELKRLREKKAERELIRIREEKAAVIIQKYWRRYIKPLNNNNNDNNNKKCNLSSLRFPVKNPNREKTTK
ncbi:hypothetical protein Glove_169g49 [Diversispora epigaea]|uniref:SCN5A-like C-terminal IQ motif domain-containing protein n=1 Tax=Diversispora epigaea TaxID=1348612 RepID=A0A397IXQ3_9GLOM|nr:hypothetical protein Glove_169g49 [Diversispora epigaea]